MFVRTEEDIDSDEWKTDEYNIVCQVKSYQESNLRLQPYFNSHYHVLPPPVTRTRTALLPGDFKSPASTNSASGAPVMLLQRYVKHHLQLKLRGSSECPGTNCQYLLPAAERGRRYDRIPV